MRRLLSCVAVLATLFVSIEADYAEVTDPRNVNSQYGLVYALDFENNHQKKSNSVDGDEDVRRDFQKLPENGLLIIRLLPKSMLRGTVLENVANDRVPTDRRFKRSPGRGGGGGGCKTCGGGGGRGGGGGGGSAGAWSNSSSGAWGKGGGKGK